MVALVFIVAALAATSLGLALLYRWARKLQIEDVEAKHRQAADHEDAGGFAHIGILDAASTASASSS
jgi:hypothetical protein